MFLSIYHNKIFHHKKEYTFPIIGITETWLKANPIFNSGIIDIDKSEVNSRRDISVIILYRPPNTDSRIFMKDMEEMFFFVVEKMIYLNQQILHTG